MPRLKKTDLELFHLELIGTIKKRLYILGMKPADLAKWVGVDTSTMYDRFKSPSLFRLDELYFMCKKLGMSLSIEEKPPQS